MKDEGRLARDEGRVIKDEGRLARGEGRRTRDEGRKMKSLRSVVVKRWNSIILGTLVICILPARSAGFRGRAA